MRSVDQAEAAQADFVVCCTVAALPVISSLPPQIQAIAREVRQRSVRQPCARCGVQIMVDRANPPNVPAICTGCNDHLKALVARAGNVTR